MIGIIILLGGMVAFATIIGVMDLLAERDDVRRRKRLEGRKHA